MFSDFESTVTFFELIGRDLLLCERERIFQVSEYPNFHHSLSETKLNACVASKHCK